MRALRLLLLLPLLLTPFAGRKCHQTGSWHLAGGALTALTYDFNSDGVPELLLGTNSGLKLVRVNRTLWSYDGTFRLRPEVADLNSDGVPEVLAVSEDGYLHLIREGKALWKVWVGLTDVNPIATDLDGDGRLEAVVLSSSGLLQAFDAEGNIKFLYQLGRPQNRLSLKASDRGLLVATSRGLYLLPKGNPQPELLYEANITSNVDLSYLYSGMIMFGDSKGVLYLLSDYVYRIDVCYGGTILYALPNPYDDFELVICKEMKEAEEGYARISVVTYAITPGGPQKVFTMGSLRVKVGPPEIILAPPSIKDVDRDGKVEVVYGITNIYGGPDRMFEEEFHARFSLSSLKLVKRQGKYAITNSTHHLGGLWGITTSHPVAVDLDCDGFLEVVYFTNQEVKIWDDLLSPALDD